MPIRFLVALITGMDGEVRTLKLMSDGIPEDAIIIGWQANFEHDQLHVKVMHPSFAAVPEGCAYEQIAVYFEKGPDDNFLELF